jgi:type VI secretion system protein ImpL
LALLVWFAGDLISIGGRTPLASPSMRLSVIGGCSGVGGSGRSVPRCVRGLRNRRLVERLGLVTTPTEADPAEAASERGIRCRSTSASRMPCSLLKNSEVRAVGWEGRWIYQLPWYLIIGPPGCGKTTALSNSGLRFPLADQVGKAAVQGVGGTRNCDWWFAEDAVLLDTAGRYTTQDSYQQVDSAAWQGFLGMLKKHRPRRPINGVLVS